MLASCLRGVRLAWIAGRERRSAVRLLEPYLGRTHWQAGAAREVWLDAYLIGFLTRLITRSVARRRPQLGQGPRGQEALGLIQSEACGALLGITPDLIGQRILTLSLSDDPELHRGCGDAARFDEALARDGRAHREAALADELARGGPPAAPTDAGLPCAALWDEYVGRRVGDVGSRPGAEPHS